MFSKHFIVEVSSLIAFATPTFLLPTEGSFDEVGQLIVGIKFGSFLKPDMAPKNDARHGIGLS